MSFCGNCGEFYTERLSGKTLQWVCPQCGRVADAKPEETMLASVTVRRADAGGSSLYADMLAHAGHDPVNVKVVRACPTCKSPQRMSRILLGVSEHPTDICEKCDGVFTTDVDKDVAGTASS